VEVFRDPLESPGWQPVVFAEPPGGVVSSGEQSAFVAHLTFQDRILACANLKSKNADRMKEP
jgi:hypothetical protein